MFFHWLIHSQLLNVFRLFQLRIINRYCGCTKTRIAQRPIGLNTRGGCLLVGEALRCQRRWLGSDDKALILDVKKKIMVTL